jgi:3-hydroxyacyl-CoA dehydrogenase/enoyl-CoA hydratase/3-hydroxybutyryl-CoA epimerase
MGLVTEVVEPAELIAAAKALIKNWPRSGRAVGREGLQGTGRRYLVAGRACSCFRPPMPSCAAKPTCNYPGAHAILKCVYEGLQVPFDTASRSSSAISPPSCRPPKPSR